jgi:hypothetical protein
MSTVCYKDDRQSGEVDMTQATKPDIRLTIYRDGAGAIYISGFTTVQQAIDAGNEWTPRLWWRVKQNGVTVAEEPKEVKR